MGIDFVVRDSCGSVVGAGIDWRIGNLGVEYAEALAIRVGLKFVIEGHAQNLQVESDSELLIFLMRWVSIARIT